MKTKHTPGEWRRSGLNIWSDIPYKDNKGNNLGEEGQSIAYEIAKVVPFTSIEQAAIDAQLISAAPDLLSACQTVLKAKTNDMGEAPELCGGLADVLREAIKKATP